MYIYYIKMFDCIWFCFVIGMYFSLPLNPNRVRGNEEKITPMFAYSAMSQKYLLLHFFIVAVI